MRKGRKILSMFMVLMFVFGMKVFAAGEKDIVDTAVDAGTFTILEAALKEADLVDTLKGEGPFTVFAPTDDAFKALLKDLDITAEELLAHPQLGEVLTYHVIGDKVMAADLTDGQEAETVNGEKVKFDLTGDPMVSGSKISTPDIEATNGVIHVIDKVLVPKGFKLDAEVDKEADKEMPKTVVDIALSNDDFSILVSALKQAKLVGTLQGEGPFTVFAPTNKAFENLLSELKISAADLLAQPDLAKVLTYHVVPGKVMAAELTDGLEAKTVNGQTVKFDLTGDPMVSGSKISATDIEAENGVVHVIDKVLVPSDFKLQEIKADNGMPKTGIVDLMPIIGISAIILVGSIVVMKRRTFTKG